MLIDTDVLIWYMRGNLKAQKTIDTQRGFNMSVISYIELVQGMRNKREFIALKRALRNWQTRIVYVNEEISAKAMFYVEQHYLSHSIQLADALIGATSVVIGTPLLTANDKHYRAIKEVDIRRFRP
ncbi:MAG: type II toxin-antitoxin system VapC family toxin [bacterium]